jgi:anti-sigma B factor antagonist
VTATIQTKSVGPVTIVQVRGALTIGEREFGLRRAIRAALDEGCRLFVINLQELSFVDSSGVAEIATTHTTIANRGGRLTLCRVSQRLQDIFVTTRLNTVFTLYDSEAEALAALSVQM